MQIHVCGCNFIKISFIMLKYQDLSLFHFVICRSVHFILIQHEAHPVVTTTVTLVYLLIYQVRFGFCESYIQHAIDLACTL